MPKNPNHPARLRESENESRRAAAIAERARIRADRKGTRTLDRGRPSRSIISVKIEGGRRWELHATKGWRSYREDA